MHPIQINFNDNFPPHWRGIAQHVLQYDLVDDMLNGYPMGMYDYRINNKLFTSNTKAFREELSKALMWIRLND